MCTVLLSQLVNNYSILIMRKINNTHFLSLKYKERKKEARNCPLKALKFTSLLFISTKPPAKV